MKNYVGFMVTVLLIFWTHMGFGADLSLRTPRVMNLHDITIETIQLNDWRGTTQLAKVCIDGAAYWVVLGDHGVQSISPVVNDKQSVGFMTCKN